MTGLPAGDCVKVGGVALRGSGESVALSVRPRAGDFNGIPHSTNSDFGRRLCESASDSAELCPRVCIFV